MSSMPSKTTRREEIGEDNPQMRQKEASWNKRSVDLADGIREQESKATIRTIFRELLNIA